LEEEIEFVKLTVKVGSSGAVDADEAAEATEELASLTTDSASA